MNALSIIRRPWWLLSLLLISIGCSGPTGETADPTQAQEALKTVLDAWKSGEKTDALASRSPAIHVKDMDWRDGYKLVSYQAGDTGTLSGLDMNYKVTLELESPKGKAVKKTAVYTVTTRPEVLVSRQEG